MDEKLTIFVTPRQRIELDAYGTLKGIGRRGAIQEAINSFFLHLRESKDCPHELFSFIESAVKHQEKQNSP